MQYQQTHTGKHVLIDQKSHISHCTELRVGEGEIGAHKGRERVRKGVFFISEANSILCIIKHTIGQEISLHK